MSDKDMDELITCDSNAKISFTNQLDSMLSLNKSFLYNYNSHRKHNNSCNNYNNTCDNNYGNNSTNNTYHNNVNNCVISELSSMCLEMQTNGLNKSPPNSANSITTTTATAAIKVKPTANKPPVPYKPPGLNQKSAPGKQTTQHQPSAPNSQRYQTGVDTSHTAGAQPTQHDWSRRPLPAPPRPPKPKARRSLSTTTRDASVSTQDNDLNARCDRETQLDARNNSLWEDSVNCMDMLGDPNDPYRTPTNPLTPTTPTNPPHMAFGTAYDDGDLTVALTHTSSTTNWYDAEPPAPGDVPPRSPPAHRRDRDWDQDTINDDVSSIASNYQSFASDYTTRADDDEDDNVDEVMDRYGDDQYGDREETPVAEVTDVDDVGGHVVTPPPRPLSSDYTTTAKTACKTAVRSQSTRAAPDRGSHSPGRRSLPTNMTGEVGDHEVDIPELKAAIDNRMSSASSGLTSERPDSVISSSDASLHETTPADTSSEGDDYSLSSEPTNTSTSTATGGADSLDRHSPDYQRRKQQQKLFFIARELYSSEEVFIDVLHLLNTDFRSAVEPHIPDEALQSILKLLPQLLQINEQLVKDLKSRIDDWPNHQRISDVLVKICPFLKQYSLYIRDFEHISAAYDECQRRYPAFAAAVKEFESTARCQKLSVKHYMLKPVQRLPQYRLLLQDYLQHLAPDSADYEDTCRALTIVSQVAEHANNSMKNNENISKLLSIQNSIIGGTEVIRPGRVFVKEGELMKLSRKGMQDRWFILFNDCLMYLTAVQNGVYRVNHELSLTGMRVSLPAQQDFQNEFSVISHTRSFSLAARSMKEREEWVSELNKAIKENTTKRISFAKSGSVCNDETLIPALDLGTVAPVWIPDARVTMCQLCTEEFSVTYRRHHCRCCGKVVCGPCSQNKAPLPYLKNRTARVCDECFEKLRQQMERHQKRMSAASGTSLDLSLSSASAATGAAASASDTDDSGWSGLREWPQLFARNLVRSSHRKAKHRYVPSVLKEVSANDVGSLISGYLHRRESRKNWKNYWFVIKDMVLYTYKASEDVAALKSQPLLGFKVDRLRDAVDGIDAKLLVQLSHPGQPTLIFRAETVGSAERWFVAMQTATTLE